MNKEQKGGTVGFLEQAQEKAEESVWVLKHTTRVSGRGVRKPPGHVWEKLAGSYKTAKTTERKALGSILNSLLTQRRAVFVVSRRSLCDLVRDDRNIEGSGGFQNEKYPSIIVHLRKSGLFSFLKSADKKFRTAFVIEVTSPEILAELGLTSDEINEQKMDIMEKIEACKASVQGPMEKIEACKTPVQGPMEKIETFKIDVNSRNDDVLF